MMNDERPVVLVVEDEPLIRMEAVDMVESAGFDTLEAGSAEAAIRMIEGQPEIAILFTDIDMPGPLDGLDLARIVRNRWPHIVIFVASGVVDLHRKSLPDGLAFFPKPYPTTQIDAALKRVMMN